jgi:hypothetical protein
MLINEPKIYQQDPIYAAIAKALGGSDETIELKNGIYQLGCFGGSSFLGNYEHYPNFDEVNDDYRGPYGVADDIDQILAKYPELEASDRKFIVTVTPVVKADQSPHGGWRWHKWGTYIGTHDIQCEYLYDEQGIEQVFCFHIYEKLSD